MAARGTCGERVRRLGVLIPLEEGDAETQGELAAFKQQLGALGWNEGGNVQVEHR